MSFALPANFTSTIAAFLIGCGDVVVFTQQDGGVTLTLKGSVQRGMVQPLTGDAIQEGYLVYLPGDSFGAIIPARFDRLTVLGDDRAIDNALPILAGGVIQAWQLTVIG